MDAPRYSSPTIDRDQVDRLEQGDGLRVGRRLLDRQRAGELERHVGGVHRVGLAVEEGDPDVDHRVAGEDALLQLVADALLHARDELPRHRTADDLVHELEAGAALERLDLDVAHRVLAVAAGLLHVPTQRGRLGDEGLAQRDLHAPPARPSPGSGRRAGRAAGRRAPGRSSTAPAGRCRHARAGRWRPRPRAGRVAAASLSSSLRVAARIASGSSGVGSSQWRDEGRPCSFVDRVSPVSAVVSFGSITISPAMACGRGSRAVPTAILDLADALLVVVVGMGFIRLAVVVAGHVQHVVGPSGCRRRSGPSTGGRRTGRWSCGSPARPGVRTDRSAGWAGRLRTAW